MAIITYCLVAIVQHDMQLKRSTYEVLQILSISLTDKTHLRDLLDKTNFKDVKDLSTPLIPGLCLIDDYRLGVTHSRAASFFQIDTEGRCRTGKMMMYDQETGRRVKDPDKPGRTK